MTLNEDGCAVVLDAIPLDCVRAVIGALERLPEQREANARGIAGDVREVAELAASAPVRELATAIVGNGAFVARSILFDKTPGANWKVAWHQDLTIAVLEKRDVPGFGPWSVKRGVIHVQPPVAVLERMITLRIHLDECDESNGALRVIPGSHRGGRLATTEIAAWRERVPEVTCGVPRGSILVMRPLLLHASSPALRPAHRRVIHLEFAASKLPSGLKWAQRGIAMLRGADAGSESCATPRC